MTHFVEFKMQCDSCDRIGTCASQNSDITLPVSLALMIPAGWQIRTWSYQPGMATDLRILCPDCAVKSAAHHESWKKDVTP